MTDIGFIKIKSNERQFNMISEWLTKFNRNRRLILKANKMTRKKNINNIFNSSCLLIKGDHGIGKTYMINYILSKYNFDQKRLDIKNKNLKMQSKKSNINIKEIINDTNIVNRITGKKKKKIILIDNIESITSPTEKKNVITYAKINEDKWLYPMIFISNKSHNSLCSQLNKIIPTIEFTLPSNKDMNCILNKIISNKNISIDNDQVRNLIVHNSQGDIRRLIYIIDDIYSLHKDNMTIDIVNNYFSSIKMKDIDINLFEATDALINGYDGIDECLAYYETEKVILPIMVHQYYINYIMENYTNDTSYDIIEKITNLLSEGDIIENYIFGNQDWNLHEIHGLYTCVAPSFYLHQDTSHSRCDINYGFAQDLNKTSIMRINKKNINKVNDVFQNKDIYDYICINKIIRQLINKGQIKECIDILKHYDIKLENIESLLKIDKLRNTKTSLSNDSMFSNLIS
jgi:hypothetical protein